MSDVRRRSARGREGSEKLPTRTPPRTSTRPFSRRHSGDPPYAYFAKPSVSLAYRIVYRSSSRNRHQIKKLENGFRKRRTRRYACSRNNYCRFLSLPPHRCSRFRGTTCYVLKLCFFPRARAAGARLASSVGPCCPLCFSSLTSGTLNSAHDEADGGTAMLIYLGTLTGRDGINGVISSRRHHDKKKWGTKWAPTL